MTATPEHLLPLTKVSLNMIPKAIAAIDLAAEYSGDSRTDVVNRAVQLYAYVEKVRRDGGRILVEGPAGDFFVLELDAAEA